MVTTITTVGYGDMSGHTSAERCICIFLMIVGVVGFSFATGSLSSLMSNLDQTQAKLKEKMETLDYIRQHYDIDDDLASKLTKAIKYDHQKSLKDMMSFMQELPYKLRTEVALRIHQEIYVKINIFKSQSQSFIIWVGPLLKPYWLSADDFIYSDGD